MRLAVAAALTLLFVGLWVLVDSLWRQNLMLRQSFQEMVEKQKKEISESEEKLLQSGMCCKHTHTHRHTHRHTQMHTHAHTETHHTHTHSSVASQSKRDFLLNLEQTAQKRWSEEKTFETDAPEVCPCFFFFSMHTTAHQTTLNQACPSPTFHLHLAFFAAADVRCC